MQNWDLPGFLHEDMDPRQPLAVLPEKKIITIDVNEFLRTRDALGSAYITLSASIDKAVKAYIDHTNVVLAGDSSLNVSLLTQPFNQLATTAQQALLQGHGLMQMPFMPPAMGAVAGAELGKEGKRKRQYKKRDPNAPKRPLTAYFRFLQEQRKGLAEEMRAKRDGPQKPGDLTKLATEKWAEMSEAQQKPYRDQYKAALEDYATACAKYKAQGGVIDDSIPTTVVAGPDPDDNLDDEGEDEDGEHEEDEEVPAPPPKPARARKATSEVPASPDRKRKGAGEDSPAKKRNKAPVADMTEPGKKDKRKKK